jgi:succinate dehydrogenase / fumarate reductase membrane anchor subunit
MHFIVPGGVANIDQAMVVARWTDPAWGLFWRTFDLLLLAFASTHGANGLRRVIQDYIHNRGWRIASTTLLSLVWFTLMAMGVIIIFSFKVR